MGLSFNKYLLILFLGVLFFAVSCDKDKDEPVAMPVQTGALQFNLLDKPLSKVSYDDVHTSFENNDLIGCVVAAKSAEGYEFKSNTRWQYQDGVLILQEDTDDIRKWYDEADVETTTQMSAEGYVQLLGDYDYAFFFYYPYTEAMTSFDHTVSMSEEQTTAEAMTGCDFLWTGYVIDQKTNQDNITAANANYPVNLTFEKKTAVIDIYCDGNESNKLTNPYIQIGTTDTTIGENAIYKQAGFDMTTGLYDFQSNTSLLPVSWEDTANLYPCLISGNEEDASKVYRMHVIPQTIKDWSLVVTINGAELDPISLEDKFTLLEEGKLYILHIAPAENGFIVINDWQNGGAADLIEDQTLPENLALSSDNEREMVDGAVLVKAGENLIVTGDNLEYASSLRLEGVYKLTDYTRASDNTDITFSVPAEAKDGEVFLVTSGGVAVSAGTYVLVKPVAASVDKTTVRPGDVITIKGTDLDLVTGVQFGDGATASVSINAEGTELTVTVPGGAASGVISLQLANGTTIPCDALAQITVAVPEPTGISAEKFKAGAVVTIIGKNLDLINGVVLKWGDTTFEVEYAKVDAATVTFEIPGEALDGSVYVTAISGEEIKAGDYELVKPVVTSETPISAEPGQTLELTGTDLDLVTGVKFYDNIDPSEYPSINASSITVKVPGNASTGVLRLSLANGTYVDIQLTVNKVSVASLSTEKGDNDGNNVQEIREGGDITISGTNLGLVKSVRIDHGGNSVSVEITDSDLADGLTFTLPAEVTAAGTIYLANQYGYEVQAGSYEMAFPTGVSLSSPIKAGQPFDISGTDIDLVTSITLPGSGVLANSDWSYTDGKITVTALPVTAVDGQIVLTTKYEKSVYVSCTLVKPTATSYSVDGVVVTEAFVGESLTINGTDLDLVTGVTFTGAESVTPTSISADAITVTVPSEAKTGKIYLNLANGTSVECPELTIDYPWCNITDDLNAMEIYSGSTIEVNVANGSALTGVQVNGADVSCSWSESKLTIEIPADAGKNTTLTLISGDKGSVEYTFNCAKVIWSGSANMQNEDIDIAASQSTIQSGSLIILECTQSQSSNGYVSLKYKSNQQEVLAGYQFPWVGSETERTVIFTITKDISEDIYVDTAVWGGTITLNRIIIK